MLYFGKMEKNKVVNACFGNTAKKRMVNIGDHKWKLCYKGALLQTFSSGIVQGFGCKTRQV